ncbi:hypothetical protein V5799_025855, partial [Amblyomma americanum]
MERVAAKEKLMALPKEQRTEEQADLLTANTNRSCRTPVMKQQQGTVVRIEERFEQERIKDDGTRNTESFKLSSKTLAFAEKKRPQLHAATKLTKQEMTPGAGKEQLTVQPTDQDLEKEASLFTARTYRSCRTPITKMQGAMVRREECVGQGNAKDGSARITGSLKLKPRALVFTVEKHTELHAISELRKRAVGLSAGKEQLAVQPTQQESDEQSGLLTPLTYRSCRAPITKHQGAVIHSEASFEQGGDKDD